LPPSKDPFYIPPMGYEKESPGTILRSRTLSTGTVDILSTFPLNISKIVQLLYRTTDGLNEPITAVTTLLIPYGADYGKLVSYQVAEDSPFIDCAPSYSLTRGGSTFNDLSQAEILLMDTLLARGWCVAVPDYQGAKSMFMVGAMAGNGVLDGIRAVLSGANGFTSTSSSSSSSSSNSSKTLLSVKNTAVQLWGYSGGALATGWATQLHATYAPELNIIGSAMGGTPADINASFAKLDKSFQSSIGVAGILGMMNQYTEMKDYIESILRPETRNEFYNMGKYCLLEMLVRYPYRNMENFVNRTDYLDSPVAHKWVPASELGNLGTPSMPLFLYHGIYDELTPHTSLLNLYGKWCTGGARIEFLQELIGTHVSIQLSAGSNAILFLEKQFNNYDKGLPPPPPGCSARTSVTSLTDPLAMKTLGKLVRDGLNAIMGNPLGIGRLL
ncbi:secretory lipase-domain-containing protein, partial [Halteromyces radiatus]|uniref:secretory lipase-domain-containing protein n=1 Tax=Halteromyces radiatus TaxID=101107 RepID=UPI00222126FF